MEGRIKRRYRSVIPKKNKKAGSEDLSREEVKSAVDEYLAKGGKITRIEPIWIEEGRSYMFE